MTLHHYTSSYGLLGILQTKKLWASHAAFMNDYQELKYGAYLVKSILGSYMIKQTGAEKIFFESITKRYSEVQEKATIFFTCFCEDGDLLSQWRAYGSDGQGFSLGFNLEDLKLINTCTIEKVIYDREEQSTLVIALIESFEITDNLIKLGDYVEQLQLLTCKLKHPQFKEEKEWRLINAILYWERGLGPGDLTLNFKISNGQIIPYTTIDLPLSDDGSFAITKLKSITFGPTNNEIQVREMLDWLLWHNYYRGNQVKILQSETPFRK